MKQTNTLIIGASISGLASAVCLQKKGIDFIIIEKQNQVATPWRKHYDRLHLHTNKRISGLPYKKFAGWVPRYPERQQVVEYLDEYRNDFNINPIFNTEAISVKTKNGNWITQTPSGSFQSKNLVMATGIYGTPKRIDFKGAETFEGRIMHSSQYKTGKVFSGQKVLVVGFGNSACEIAIDLYEQGAFPSMSVRSAVNVIPRDVLGLPVLELSLALRPLPPRIADTVSAPLLSLLIGDITKLGLKKLPYGPLEQIRRDGTVPLLDIGTVRHIREGHIKIYDNIEHIERNTVFFEDGKNESFDTIVAGIGYSPNFSEIDGIDKDRFDDLKFPVDKQKYFGKDNLYFCGYWISPTGQIREISLDAKKIAKAISEKENRSSFTT